MLLVTLPLVAVIKILVVPVWWVVPPELALLPPQPESIAKLSATTVHIQTAPRITLRPLDIRKANRAESINPNSPTELFREAMLAELTAAFWLIVKLTFTVPDAGRVACDGLKLHATASGSPTQAKLTCPENDEKDVTVSATGADGSP